LSIWFSPVTAVRIEVLLFWGGYADWGLDEESKTILHPSSSSSDDCHDSGVSNEASWLLPSSVLLLHNGLPGSCSGNSVDNLIYRSCSGLRIQLD
jgi:hypothetical protein